MSIVVDLPAPFGPRSATVSPLATADIDAAHGLHDAVRRAERLRDALEANLAHDACTLRLCGGVERASPPSWKPVPATHTSRSGNDTNAAFASESTSARYPTAVMRSARIARAATALSHPGVPSSRRADAAAAIRTASATILTPSSRLTASNTFPAAPTWSRDASDVASTTPSTHCVREITQAVRPAARAVRAAPRAGRQRARERDHDDGQRNRGDALDQHELDGGGGPMAREGVDHLRVRGGHRDVREPDREAGDPDADVEDAGPRRRPQPHAAAAPHRLDAVAGVVNRVRGHRPSVPRSESSVIGRPVDRPVDGRFPVAGSSISGSSARPDGIASAGGWLGPPTSRAHGCRRSAWAEG